MVDRNTTTEAYVLARPKRVLAPVLFASPHSGAEYPEDFLRRTVLERHVLRSSEDAYVDRLYDQAPRLGAPLLSARMPRAYLDLNRASDELDPAVVEDVQRAAHNPRILAGLGVIPRVVARGRSIYRGKISRIEADDRLNRFWQPYHDALAQELAEIRAGFGRAILLDCHSMPHDAIESTMRDLSARPDVVLGDRFGASAMPELTEEIAAAFREEGLRVARNAPFAGAYIAQAYGRPSLGVSVIQIEIDRALYMDELTVTPRADFAAFRALIGRVQARILGHLAQDLPLAAE